MGKKRKTNKSDADLDGSGRQSPSPASAGAPSTEDWQQPAIHSAKLVIDVSEARAKLSLSGPESFVNEEIRRWLTDETKCPDANDNDAVQNAPTTGTNESPFDWGSLIEDVCIRWPLYLGPIWFPFVVLLHVIYFTYNYLNQE